MGPAVAVVGPTASGKSAVALAAARARPGTVELVSVDSMQVYRGMDIGTAKPTLAERAEVPHHLIDVADPEEDYSVARFQVDARAAVEQITARGNRAILVGGTGLHLRAVLDDLDIPGQWPDLRAELEVEVEQDGAPALHARLAALDPLAASRMEPTNGRRIVRALEVTLGAGRPFSSFGPGLTTTSDTTTTIVGLHVDSEVLAARIAARYRQQLDAGFLDEVRALAPRLSRTAGQALGYKELAAHLRGECTLDEAVDLAVRRTRRFARRQRAWFRRDPRVTWVDATEGPDAAIASGLAALDAPD